MSLGQLQTDADTHLMASFPGKPE